MKPHQQGTFDGVKEFDVVLGDDSERFAAPPSTRGSSHSMDVDFGLSRQIEIHHQIYRRNVQTPRRHVSRDQNLSLKSEWEANFQTYEFIDTT